MFSLKNGECATCQQNRVTKAKDSVGVGVETTDSTSVFIQTPTGFEKKAEHISGKRHFALTLTLSSGVSYNVSQICLKRAAYIRRLHSLEERIGSKMEASSLGVGFWGGAGFVVGAAYLSGLVERAVDSTNRAEATELAERWSSLKETVQKNSVAFDISDIENIELCSPGSWLARIKGEGAEVAQFIHDGGEFIDIFDEHDQLCSIRWSSVVSYTITSKPVGEACR